MYWIVMNVLARRCYENELLIWELCITSCCLHDLTLSLLRLVLLPGYYFLWQHLSRQGEQLWKDPDNWLPCILWTGSPYMTIEKHALTRTAAHKNSCRSPVCLSAVADIFTQTKQNDFRFYSALIYGFIVSSEVLWQLYGSCTCVHQFRNKDTLVIASLILFERFISILLSYNFHSGVMW